MEGPLDPGQECGDVALLDGRATPDAKPRRRRAIGGGVERHALFLQQRGEVLRELRLLVRRQRGDARIDHLQADAGVAACRAIGREEVDPGRGFDPIRRSRRRWRLRDSSATAAEALDEVARARAAFAVFPFESSVDGLVQPSLTALAETELVLVGERSLPATYHLMGAVTTTAEVERVYLTAAAHAACQRFLDQELPRAAVIDVRSPAVAAELAKEEKGSAAVLPESTGSAPGLALLASEGERRFRRPLSLRRGRSPSRDAIGQRRHLLVARHRRFYPDRCSPCCATSLSAAST